LGTTRIAAGMPARIKETPLGFILWIAAVVLVIVGIVQLFQDQFILGIVLIIVGLAVGPGGFSIFKRRAGT
jgi:CDP-diglyceride synthetase